MFRFGVIVCALVSLMGGITGGIYIGFVYGQEVFEPQVVYEEVEVEKVIY